MDSSAVAPICLLMLFTLVPELVLQPLLYLTEAFLWSSRQVESARNS